MKINLVVLLLICLNSIYAQNNKLPIPPLLTGSELVLNIKEGELKLPSGTSKTMGYNGNYLGPTIYVENGDELSFLINNNINDDTTVHWHGLHVPAEYDGGPHQVIRNGSTWNPKFTINQQAATLWYHPHLMGKTAEHVYHGLAGMFYISDEYSESLEIPQDYGVNDFPLVIQDRRVQRDGNFEYRPSMHDEMQGYIGNTILVNGANSPNLELDAGTYRFRLLNGSNSSIYRLRFSNNKSFTVIASDGGFLPKTIVTEYVIISPGERYEILIDLDRDENINLITDIYNGPSFKTLTISTGQKRSKTFKHPDSFEFISVDYDETNSIKRDFIMETRMMGRFTINGKQMSMDRIDFTLNKNSSEIWTIENVGMGMMRVPHSFHVHDVQFNILSINGKRPDPLYAGRKDTILVMPGEVYKIALRFEEYTGIYMYHCHFLEHEDNGMMGQFLIE